MSTLGQFYSVGVPAGVITMWSGSTTVIPEGWNLCDGTNGTPDLRDRFVVGAGTTYAVDATGGSADSVVVDHDHTASSASAGDHTHNSIMGSSGFHTHTGTTNSAGSHDHAIAFSAIDTGTGTAANVYRPTSGSGSSNGVNSAGSHTHSFTTYSSGNHNHTLDIQNAGSHSHSITVNSQGESGTNKNLPPYYALAYIMKL